MGKKLPVILGMAAAIVVAGLALASDAGMSAPTLIVDSRVSPTYPPAALAAKSSGSVTLRISVLSDGSVGPVEVLESTRPRLGFEDAAAEAVRQWRFEPARIADEPVEAYSWVRLHFNPPGSAHDTGFVAGELVSNLVGGVGWPAAPAASARGGDARADTGNHTAATTAQSRFSKYGKPPCAEGCLYSRKALIPPPNYGYSSPQGNSGR